MTADDPAEHGQGRANSAGGAAMRVETASEVRSAQRLRWQRGAHDPDAERVVAAQADPAQFVALYDLYVDRIHDYICARLPNPAISEDVTSHVFTTALARIGRFRTVEGGSFAAWLFRIAHNAVQDIYRQKDEQRGAGRLFETLSDPDPGPEEQVLARGRACELRHAIAQLRPEQQHLLALRFGADFGIAEIAHTVGKSAVAVRVSLHRALRDLRRRYPNDA